MYYIETRKCVYNLQNTDTYLLHIYMYFNVFIPVLYSVKDSNVTKSSKSPSYTVINQFKDTFVKYMGIM